jgi:hypothetical protein
LNDSFCDILFRSEIKNKPVIYKFRFMSQINLLSGGEGPRLPKPSFFGGSIFFSFAVLAVSFGAYFGILVYEEALQRDVKSLTADNEAERNLIAGEKADRVADFADRLSVIEGNFKETALVPNDPLFRIERALIPEVNLTSYAYDVTSKTVEVTVAADSFRAIAQNIITLKKKETAFSSVAVDGEVKVGSNGKIEANLILSL